SFAQQSRLAPVAAATAPSTVAPTNAPPSATQAATQEPLPDLKDIKGQFNKTGKLAYVPLDVPDDFSKALNTVLGQLSVDKDANAVFDFSLANYAISYVQGG